MSGLGRGDALFPCLDPFHKVSVVTRRSIRFDRPAIRFLANPFFVRGIDLSAIDINPTVFTNPFGTHGMLARNR